jgi:dihydrofolate synthase / folylpolyglutamate synthase
VVLTEVASPRTALLADLEPAAAATGTTTLAVSNPIHALNEALEITPADGLVVVTGSVYLVGELRPALAENGK